MLLKICFRDITKRTAEEINVLLGVISNKNAESVSMFQNVKSIS